MDDKTIQKSSADQDIDMRSAENEEPAILEEINIEELAIDGICGVY